MDIGRLDRRITIESFTTSTNELNEEVKTWSTLATVWATMTYPKGLASNETDNQARQTATIPVMWWIRYREGLNETMRINYNSEYFYITRVNYPDRKTSIQLVTEKRV